MGTHHNEGKGMRNIIGAAAIFVALLPGVVAAQSYADMVYEVCANEGCIVSPETMIRVIGCETGGTWDHSVVGPNGELGILQIDPRYHAEAYGTPYQQIEYAANHLGGDVYWACL